MTEFASIKRDDWPRVGVNACRLAVQESGIDDELVTEALHSLELGRLDPTGAASMRGLAARFDEEAWDAQESAQQDRYQSLFRRSRAASALAFALSGGA
jgi:hypothetical protein